MQGISSNGKQAIARSVEEIFDRIAAQFLGDIPRMKDNKSIVFTYTPNFGLANLFVQAMGNREPNAIERDTLKSLLISADGYIQSLKHSTQANVVERIDGLAREARMRGISLSQTKVQEVLDEEMEKARSKMQTIAEAESTKLRNMGSMVDIAKVGASIGQSDPTVFFIVTKDGSTCKECIRLHLMPDGITPRLWKLSELKQGWHKRGENMPSVSGLHPHCRCTLTIMAPGFGFSKGGLVEYKRQGHDEYAAQRSA